MANKIATNKYIYTNFKVGSNDNQAPKKSVITGLGLNVTGSYSANQLVKEEDITFNYITSYIDVVVEGGISSWPSSPQYLLLSGYTYGNGNQVLYSGGLTSQFSFDYSYGTAGSYDSNYGFSINTTACSDEVYYGNRVTYSNIPFISGKKLDAISIGMSSSWIGNFTAADVDGYLWRPELRWSYDGGASYNSNITASYVVNGTNFYIPDVWMDLGNNDSIYIQSQTGLNYDINSNSKLIIYIRRKYSASGGGGSCGC